MLLGESAIATFPLSLGTGGLGTQIKGDEVNRLLDAYAEAGGNLLDTAHVYAAWLPDGEGASERAVGSWIRSRRARDCILISTKGGHPPMDGYAHASDFLSPGALRQDVKESLERLGTDWIDLYYLHRDDGRTPVGEIIDALNDIAELRSLGASNWSTSRVAEANAFAQRAGKRGFVALQNQWSLAVPTWVPATDPTNRYITDGDRDWCAANEVAIHAYTPTFGGYFSSDRADGVNEGRRERAREVAAKLEVTANQVALAWLMNQPAFVVPILGTTKVEHLKDAIGAISIKLDAATLTWLRGE